ncbi:MAG: chitobiase/beta-hexosaminidase C-terminal domain-containing protein, partial [Candidatus Aminicenantes bacterium]|nr:chitobiase/beta-hexosaminidase C-terminal domain-containing protein [Candidatus Aminicenantes bacterium]
METRRIRRPSALPVILFLGAVVLAAAGIPPAPRERVIQGRVLDWETSRPVANATIRTLPPSRQTCTDSDGRYSTGGLAEGVGYTLLAGKKGYRVHHQDLPSHLRSLTCDFILYPDDRVKEPARCSERLRIDPTPPRSIRGLIVDWRTDLTVAGVRIRTTPPTESVLTDDMGAYFIGRNVQEGEYTISAEKEGFIMEKPEGYRFRIGPDSMIRCDMPMRSQLPPPVIEPAGGTFEGPVRVSIRSGVPDAEIVYTTDGTEPKKWDTYKYNGPFLVRKTTTIKALALKAPWADSLTAEAVIRIGETGAVNAPFVRSFGLEAGGRERIPLDIDAPCTIEVTAEWEGTARTLSL